MVTSEDPYFSTLWSRFKNAIKRIEFWRGFIAIFFFGGMGIWIPYCFDWPGYLTLYEPQAIFTFGIATLAIILEARLFMERDDDGKWSNCNKLIVFIIVVISLVLSIKSGISNDHSMGIFTLLLILFIWIYNHINQSIYDNSCNINPLGGDV